MVELYDNIIISVPDEINNIFRVSEHNYFCGRTVLYLEKLNFLFLNKYFTYKSSDRIIKAVKRSNSDMEGVWELEFDLDVMF
ncbi:MAG: hypothetical protein K0B02_02150 [DPANN group archaeon]|nr:hypothetical protein [DPANN group archaeon]